MDEIAEAVESSKGTLYLYYKSKEDLYLVQGEGLSQCVAGVSKACEQNLLTAEESLERELSKGLRR